MRGEGVIKLDRGIQWLEKAIIGVAFVVMVAVTFAQVLARFVFRNPISWSEEVARYLFVWITLMGAAHAVAYAKHFSVDFLISRLPPHVQAATGKIALFTVLLFAALMVGYGGYVTQFTKFQVSPALLLPMTYPYLCIPVSGLFMIIHILRIYVSGPEVVETAEESEGGYVE